MARTRLSKFRSIAPKKSTTYESSGTTDVMAIPTSMEEAAKKDEATRAEKARSVAIFPRREDSTGATSRPRKHSTDEGGGGCASRASGGVLTFER